MSLWDCGLASWLGDVPSATTLPPTALLMGVPTAIFGLESVLARLEGLSDPLSVISSPLLPSNPDSDPVQAQLGDHAKKFSLPQIQGKKQLLTLALFIGRHYGAYFNSTSYTQITYLSIV